MRRRYAVPVLFRQPSATRSPRHEILAVDAIDRQIDILAGPFKARAPVPDMAEHPEPARILVVAAHGIDNHTMRVNEARHALLHLAQDHLRGWKDQEARGLARELQHPVAGGLGNQGMKLRV